MLPPILFFSLFLKDMFPKILYVIDAFESVYLKLIVTNHLVCSVQGFFKKIILFMLLWQKTRKIKFTTFIISEYTVQ